MNKFLILTIAMIFVVTACGDDDPSSNDNSAPTGILEITGTYDGTITDEAKLMIAVFDCPFSMPPIKTGEGTVDAATGETYGLVENIEEGDWCFLAYIDMDPSDGFAPVSGLDVASIASSEDGGEPITITAKEVTTSQVVYQMYQ